MKYIPLKWRLNLHQTLLGGQSFRWTKTGEDFLGVFSNILWKLNVSDNKLFYEILGELDYPEDINSTRIKAAKPQKVKNNTKLLYKDKYYEELLINYFRLDSPLNEDYAKWIESHKHFETKASEDTSLVTQINQDIIETIFSFICSQNNHISRISSLVEKLCTYYGEIITVYDSKEYYNFPSLDQLGQHEDMEQKLRMLGFGYRAKFIYKSAQQISNNGGVFWLNGLLKMDYHEAHQELMKLPGIGPKVADCICLMSLNFLQAVPVDTHVIQIAQHYIEEDVHKIKSLSMKMYRKIGDTFRNVYGSNAGVAQTVLFCKELNKFSNVETMVIKKKKKK